MVSSEDTTVFISRQSFDPVAHCSVLKNGVEKVVYFIFNSDNFITIPSCKVPGKVFTLSEWLRYLREGVNLKCNILYQLLVKFLFVVL